MINSTEYSLLRLGSADSLGNDLSAPMNLTGRQLLGRFVYPLAGVTAIPSSNWTSHYRTWQSNAPENITINSPNLSDMGTWINPELAYVSNDTYAYAQNPNAQQQYGYYGLNLPSNATITKVEVGCEAYTSTNEGLGITLSWTDGVGWATEVIVPQLGGADLDAVTWVDFSNATDWTASKLSDMEFRTRVRAIRTGMAMGTVFLDWIPVRVTYIYNPPVAHASLDILIRKSDGTIRQTIATDAANSYALSTFPQTLLGNYSWSSYVVVNETDYLETDYYLDIEATLDNVTAYLRIDDVGLTLIDQSRITGVILPNEYAMEVELSGSSNTDSWSTLFWTIDSAWSTGGVSVELQLYNYTLNAYSLGGDGYIQYLSSATSETNETKSQIVTSSPMDFRDSQGKWKMKIKGVKATTSQFYCRADLAKYEVTSNPLSDIAIQNITCSSNSIYAGESVTINVTVINEGETTQTFNVTVLCNGTSIGKQLVSDLAPSTSVKLTFNWNTTGAPLGSYAINAVADTVPEESDTSDNVRIYGNVTIHPVTSENGPSLFPYILPICLVAVGAISGIVLKKRLARTKSAGFNYFNEILGGGIPAGSSVLIVGDTGSGKSLLCQQLAHKCLTDKKAVVFASYDDLPDRIRKNMQTIGSNLSKFEEERALIFIDCCSSMAGARSKEKHSVQQPFALTELSIATSTALDETNIAQRTLFLDSATSLFGNLDASRVIGFLQDRSAKIKADNGIFVFTLGKETLQPKFANRLEEAVDCIIELSACEERGSSSRKLRVKKLTGQKHSEEWVKFTIEPDRGIVFQVKKTK
jgi:KaiC/GvpD/RAD55 family RecA-like ATPase